MKLAEALQERADLKIRIQNLRQRLLSNALVQEGEKPSEDPAELLKELQETLSREEKLVAAINLRNCITRVENRSLTEMIAMRDTLTEKISIYRDIVSAASNIASRASGREIRILSTYDVRALQKETDRLASQLRELNNKIQSTNWTTGL